jgi:DNA-binding FrmR family transcriptional regulator
VEAALAKCDREARRWAEAYAQEVINVDELKGYRAEITARRQNFQAEYTRGRGQLDAIGDVVQQAERLSDYCARVYQQLHAFDHAEKRLAFEALDIRVSWTPGQPLQIEGCIPLDAIVNNPA